MSIEISSFGSLLTIFQLPLPMVAESYWKVAPTPEAEGQAAAAYATGGIYAGHKLKADLPAGKPGFGIHAAGDLEGSNARPRGHGQMRQASVHQNAVFARQRHNVGQGSQRH